MKIIINLNSEQTLPNFYFTKKHADFDLLYFITTDQFPFKKQPTWLKHTLKLNTNKVKNITVLPNDIRFIYNELDKQHLKWQAATEILINISCGTKLMALAISNYFNKYYEFKVKTYYLPFNKNAIYETTPPYRQEVLDFSPLLKEYLGARGLTIQQTEKDYKKYKKLSQKIMMDVLRGNGKYYNRIFHRHNFSPFDRSFYGGVWLEHYLTNKIQETLKISDENILCGAKLGKIGFSTTYSYEYDVIFMYKGKIFVCECKYYKGGNLLKSKFKSDIRKMKSLKNDFGLDVVPFFIFANTIEEKTNQNIKEEFKNTNIKDFANINDLKSNKNFEAFLNRIIQM